MNQDTKSPERSRRPKIRPKHIAVSLLVVAAGFVWGMGYVKHYWFPYHLVRKAKARLEKDPVLFSRFSASGGVSYQKSSSFDDISSLPYIGTAEGTDDDGDGPAGKIIDSEKSFLGLNLFTQSNSDQAYLMDMQGNMLREWILPRRKVHWDSPIAERQGFTGWRSVQVDPELNLTVIYDYLGIAKLDAYSNPVWLNRNGAHHSFFVTPSGDIFTLTSRLETIPDIHPTQPLICDYVAVIDSSGVQKAEYSIIEIIRNSGYSYLLPSVAHENPVYPIDLLHTNSIEVIDGSDSSASPSVFKKGNVLLSIRNISTIMIVDLEEKAVRWIWGPSNIIYQHTPRIVPGPHILLFNNGVSRSSVLEMDPFTYEVLWKFSGAKDSPLSSRIYGACQRLPNGNVLITDSLQARALEVTQAGEIVWTYQAPSGDNNRLPALFEMRRYPPDYFRGQ